MTGISEATPAQEWRGNWPVVLAGAAGGCLASVHLYSIGVMIDPLEREFGWSRAQVSSGLSVVAVVAVLLSPLIGMVIDRIGARRVGLLGICLFCFFLALLSQATDSIALWWAMWLGIALAAACIAPTVWAAGVTSLFSASRGMALAVTLCGTSIGALIVPLVTHLLVDSLGWRGAYLGLAGIWGLVVLPLVWFGFSSSIDRSRKQQGQGKAAAPPLKDGPPALRSILSWRFIRLTLGAITIVTVASSLIANFVPILVAEGHTAGRAAAMAGLVGAGSMIGRLIGGYLLDRIDGRLVCGISVLTPVGTCLALLFMPGSVVLVSAGIFVLGLAVGVEWDGVAYLASRHFGVASFGTIFGTIGGMSLLLNGMGPVITNYSFDVTGTYVAALWAFIPLCLVSSAMFFLLGPIAPESRGS
ncbi:MAG: MFS transporter [Novosphingobium sp.]|nr:MFS transporter [Novosphingobium sp.]